MSPERDAAMKRHPAGKARQMPLTPPPAPHPTTIINDLAEQVFEATVPRPYAMSTLPRDKALELDVRAAQSLVDYVRDLQHRNVNLGSMYANESSALERVRGLAQKSIDRDIGGEATVPALDVLDAITANPLPSEATE